MVFSSSAYGLSLGSNQPIPGLRNQSDCVGWVDLEISFQSLPSDLAGDFAFEWIPHHRFQSRHPYDQGEQARLRVNETSDGRYTRLSYYGGIDFIFDREATHLWITYPSELTLEHISQFLLNPALCFCLRLRNTVCLHASAIVVDKRALLIAGASGAGKSTTATVFAIHGHPIISDDVSALFLDGAEIFVQPGYPLLRLWPPSVKALLGEADRLPPLIPGRDKRYLDLNTDEYQFFGEPLPVGGVYILDSRSDSLSITSLSRPQAVLKLMSNTYLDYLLDKQLRAIDLSLLSHLAQTVPVRLVTPPDELARLTDLYNAILRDFQTSARITEKE